MIFFSVLFLVLLNPLMNHVRFLQPLKRDTVSTTLFCLMEQQLYCHCRVSTASSQPKREFKVKSVRSSIKTPDNSQHNGLSYSSSLKSTGTDATRVFVTSVFSLSAPPSLFALSCSIYFFLLFFPDIQINHTVNGKSRYSFIP